MEGLREAIVSEAKRALAVSTAAAFTAAEGFTAVGEATEVGATDSSHEVIKR